MTDHRNVNDLSFILGYCGCFEGAQQRHEGPGGTHREWWDLQRLCEWLDAAGVVAPALDVHGMEIGRRVTPLCAVRLEREGIVETIDGIPENPL